MQALARHDVGLDAEDARHTFLDVHELKKAEPAFLVVKEKIDVRIFGSLAASRRSK